MAAIRRSLGTLWLVALAAGLAAAPEAGAAVCVRPSGAGGCFTSVQAAVGAAGTGETVYVFPGTYHEAVTIATAGVKLVGRGRTPAQVRIDGLDLGDNGILVDAPGVVVRNLTVRSSGASGVRANPVATSLLVTRVHVTRASSYGIFANAPGARVLRCRVTGTSLAGIRLEGDGAVVSRCLVSRTMGVYVDANAGQVLATRVSAAVNGTSGGIYAFGDGLVVRGCTVRTSAGYGIIVEGPGDLNSSLAPIVSGNSASASQFAGVAVSLRGAGAVIGNTVRDAGLQDAGFDIVCAADCGEGRVTGNVAERTGIFRTCFHISPAAGPAGFLVEANRALSCGGAGFDVGGGMGLRFLDNLVRDAGGPGVIVNSLEALVRGNTAVGNLGSGFIIDGDALEVRANRSRGNTEHGFHVFGGTNHLVVGNVAEANLDTGILVEVGVAGTDVRNNTARGSGRCDFRDGGAGTVATGNSFGTTCPP